MQTDPNISIYSKFVKMLEFLSYKLHADYIVRNDDVYFFYETYNRNSYLKDTDFIFSFKFDSEFNCYDFESDFRNVKVVNNNYIDFLLDCYNYITKRNLNK